MGAVPSSCTWKLCFSVEKEAMKIAQGDVGGRGGGQRVIRLFEPILPLPVTLATF